MPLKVIKMEEPLTSTTRPPTDALITVRIIKSFPYRNVKNYIMNNINLKSTTPKQLLENINDIINSTGSLRPYRNVKYDSLKIYSTPHGTKSMNLIINLGEPEKVLTVDDKENISLWDLGITNESELSCFNWQDYLEFEKNPEEKW